mgnify:FL=1|jgi:hypothetical protein
MLVTDPKQRASLAEIMSHPWMNKGFSNPPENHLPHREPLQLPLDQEVVEKMTGFDFGPPEYITAQLTKVLESEDYQHAIRLYMREQHQPVSNHPERKRGVFDFYKRRNSAASRDTLSAPSAEAVQLGNDPLNAYSPLVSTYHLVKEKLDRERSEARPGALGLGQTPSEVHMPELRPPEAAHTNQYQLAGDKDTGRRSRPRARTHGEDEVTEGMKVLHSSSPSAHAPAPQPDTPAKKESTAAGILRRFSTRRTKDRGRDVDRERIGTPNTPTLNVQPPADSASPMHRGFSVRRTRRAEPSPGETSSNDSRPQQDLLAAPGSSERNVRSNKFLERSTSVNSADYRARRATRRSDADALDVPADRQQPSTSDSDQVAPNNQRDPASVRAGGRTHTARTMSLGHARRESIQARRARRDATREANVPEETDADISGAGTALESANEGEDLSKPVYLKGLFSVSTTSSKPLPVIRADIIRVLRQLSVEYVEIKGGFSCRHAPSIELDKVVDVAPPSPERQGQVSGHRRRISFGGLLNHDETRDDNRTGSSKLRRAQAAPDRSFTTNSDASDEYVARERGGPVGERVVGETTTRVQSDTGENLVLRFEILIVKVPLFSLHGIQFKKVSGGMWQYREMAKKILDALKL